MICTMDEAGNCQRHKTVHYGHLRDIALEDSEYGEKMRRMWDTLTGLDAPKLLRSLPMAKQCKYFGERLTPEEVKEKALAGCRSCSGIVPPYHCTLPGAKKFNDGPYTRGTDCMNCTDWQRHEKPADDAGFSWEAIRLDHFNLHPGAISGIRFNSSMIDSGDNYLYCFRNGWAGSDIYIAELDGQFKPTDRWARLELGKKGANVGREDPRLFRLNGRLHVMYTGYTGKATNVLFARVNEDTLRVEDVFFPQIPGRRSWEKNICMFDYQGVAHGIYSINPHKILRVEGHRAEWAYEAPFKGTWSGGELRGGACPVMHKGEWYHFFHGAYDIGGRRRYCTGVYTFRAEPPFDILRYTPDPIDQADLERKHDNWSDVLFIGSAIHKGDRWITANGIHDRYSEIRFYDAGDIESQLVSV